MEAAEAGSTLVEVAAAAEEVVVVGGVVVVEVEASSSTICKFYKSNKTLNAIVWCEMEWQLLCYL